MDDNQIIMLFHIRNEQALAETEKKHGTVCRKTAGKILSSQQDIEECVNDALMQAWNSIPPQRPSNLAAFLVTITRNIALNRWKHEQRFKRGGGQIALVLDELSDCIHSSEDIEETIDKRMLVQSMEAFLDSLSYDARTVFVQRYIAMLSITEIADRYHLSESKVKVTLMRVRKRLRKYLKQEGWL